MKTKLSLLASLLAVVIFDTIDNCTAVGTCYEKEDGTTGGPVTDDDCGKGFFAYPPSLVYDKTWLGNPAMNCKAAPCNFKNPADKAACCTAVASCDKKGDGTTVAAVTDADCADTGNGIVIVHGAEGLGFVATVGSTAACAEAPCNFNTPADVAACCTVVGTCYQKEDGTTGGLVTDDDCGAGFFADFRFKGFSGNCAAAPCNFNNPADKAACCTAVASCDKKRDGTTVAAVTDADCADAGPGFVATVGSTAACAEAPCKIGILTFIAASLSWERVGNSADVAACCTAVASWTVDCDQKYLQYQDGYEFSDPLNAAASSMAWKAKAKVEDVYCLALKAKVEDGITQATVDAAFANGAASVMTKSCKLRKPAFKACKKKTPATGALSAGDDDDFTGVLSTADGYGYDYDDDDNTMAESLDCTDAIATLSTASAANAADLETTILNLKIGLAVVATLLAVSILHILHQSSPAQGKQTATANDDGVGAGPFADSYAVAGGQTPERTMSISEI